ncbi:MAG: sigma-70 family RNA polymerase sigma factor [Acidobacteria bacterium]|nr:sigma-70 family RNA polymerase sigma factor [Acidobacteriota bacterium]
MSTNIPEQDRELLDGARAAAEGDYAAFEQLVHRYNKKVVANCRYLTRDADYAEDLAQEVFVKAYFGLARYEGRSSFRTWLQRIKINHCLSYLKKKRARAFVNIEDEQMKAADELMLQPKAEKALMAASEREQITNILDGMPDNLRIALLLRDMDHLPYEEVAETLGISLPAVKMRIKRGREEFRRRYRELNHVADPASPHGHH